MTEFQISNPGFENRVRQGFADQLVMKTLDMTLSAVSPGKIEITFPFAAALTQQNGFVHAGVLSTALDSACGFSAYTLMPADASVLTIETKINLLRPAADGPFRVEAMVVKPGRTIVVSEGRLYDANDKLVATMTATNMAVTDPGPSPIVGKIDSDTA